jgi:hypothetical protein
VLAEERVEFRQPLQAVRLHAEVMVAVLLLDVAVWLACRGQRRSERA